MMPGRWPKWSVYAWPVVSLLLLFWVGSLYLDTEPQESITPNLGAPPQEGAVHVSIADEHHDGLASLEPLLTLPPATAARTAHAFAVAVRGGECRVVLADGGGGGGSRTALSVVVGLTDASAAAAVSLVDLAGLATAEDVVLETSNSTSLRVAQAGVRPGLKIAWTHFWVLVDPANRWVYVGSGDTVDAKSVRLSVALARNQAEQLTNLNRLFVTNRIAPIEVVARPLMKVESALELNRYPFKFANTGEFIRFRGSTVVCMVPAESDFHVALSAMQQIIAESALAPYYVLLPPDSFHMTLFDLVHERNWDYVERADQVNWLALHEEMRSRIPPAMLAPEVGFDMALDHVHDDLHGVVLKPAEAATASALAEWRARAERLTQRPAAAGYKFHATLAYRLRPMQGDRVLAQAALLQAEMEAALQTPPRLSWPRLVRFDNMSAYLDQPPLHPRSNEPATSQ